MVVTTFRSGFLTGEAMIGAPSTRVLVVVLSKTLLLILGKLVVVLLLLVFGEVAFVSNFSILIPSTPSFSPLSSSVAMCLCS